MKRPNRGVLGWLCRKLRTENEQSQIELAEIIGVTQAHISAIECGNRQLAKRYIEKFAQALDIGNELLLSVAKVERCEIDIKNMRETAQWQILELMFPELDARELDKIRTALQEL